ncbi:MAG: ParB/RepB/Spo0J family partition protein [Candidatus Hydromicrobium sp.]|nr:ParB/RepB/Spo0J family partition protein [Candidatus Hydromicrobium sp.]
MGKIKPSVGDAVAKLIKEKKKKIPDDWFDINTSKGLVNIPLSQIIEDKNQPRKTFNSETIKELANSIKEQGVINPITVRPKGSKYVIIAGERRFLAAQEAGLKSIPALIRKASKDDVMLLSLIENIQREDLNDIDRASALKKLKESTGFTWEIIGSKLGLSKRRVLALVDLLDLPEEIKEDIRSKKLTEKHGRALRQLKDNKDEILKVSKIVKEEKLSGDETIKLVKEVKKSRYGKIIDFDLTEFNKRKNLTSKVIDNGWLFLDDLEKIENLDGSEILKEERDRLARTLNSIVLKIKNIIEGLNL